MAAPSEPDEPPTETEETSQPFHFEMGEEPSAAPGSPAPAATEDARGRRRAQRGRTPRGRRAAALDRRRADADQHQHSLRHEPQSAGPQGPRVAGLLLRLLYHPAGVRDLCTDDSVAAWFFPGSASDRGPARPCWSARSACARWACSKPTSARNCATKCRASCTAAGPPIFPTATARSRCRRRKTAGRENSAGRSRCGSSKRRKTPRSTSCCGTSRSTRTRMRSTAVFRPGWINPKPGRRCCSSTATTSRSRTPSSARRSWPWI